ncbi:MerC domain-containing protein [Novosphingobium aerophilum]|uniref:MerC domain-containing protein n=1 Tax=Novosphingobium TaxID=165696 RepID=UPI0012C668FE|nr:MULTISPECIES: MerC domain-containing protein [unclassified Novosphingobium]MPS68916.1 MerC domain-containing protein [Novosphingobium sp.]WRT94765.1 MerC domain-containing protein [Novosphingobium sp. RL4]
MSEQCGVRQVRRQRLLADFVESTAISASALCMVHCLALPLLLFLLPGLLGSFFQSEAFHVVVLGLVAPAALAAFLMGYRRHGAIGPGIVGGAGIVCLVLAVWPAGLPLGETGLTVAGSAMLVLGHGWNWQKRLPCNECESAGPSR